MSWVKIKDTNGNVLTVPETAFNDSFKNNGCVLVKDVKDKPVVKPVVEAKVVAPTFVKEPLLTDKPLMASGLVMDTKIVAKPALKGKANPFKKS